MLQPVSMQVSLARTLGCTCSKLVRPWWQDEGGLQVYGTAMEAAEAASQAPKQGDGGPVPGRPAAAKDAATYTPPSWSGIPE